MNKIQLSLLCLFMLTSQIYAIDYENRITYSIKKVSNQLTQEDLSKATQSALDWGSPATNFKTCKQLNNKYYDFVNDNSSIKKTINGLDTTHNYLWITFDSVFTDLPQYIPLIKTVKMNVNLNVDGSDSTFSGKNTANRAYCQDSDNLFLNNKGDDTATISKAYSHNKSNVTIKIEPLNLSGNQRFGVSNMQITTVQCGNNAEFVPSQSTTNCVCKSGYQIRYTQHMEIDQNGTHNQQNLMICG